MQVWSLRCFSVWELIQCYQAGVVQLVLVAGHLYKFKTKITDLGKGYIHPHLGIQKQLDVLL